MRLLHIALGLIVQDEYYVLQRRSSDQMRGGAGLIGCFGGKIEPGETPSQALLREVSEETNLEPTSADIKHIGRVKVESDHKLETVNVHGEVFQVTINKEVAIEALEGKAVRIKKDQIKDYLGEMTTGTRAAFEELILGETNGLRRN